MTEESVPGKRSDDDTPEERNYNVINLIEGFYKCGRRIVNERIDCEIE